MTPLYCVCALRTAMFGFVDKIAFGMLSTAMQGGLWSRKVCAAVVWAQLCLPGLMVPAPGSRHLAVVDRHRPSHSSLLASRDNAKPYGTRYVPLQVGCARVAMHLTHRLCPGNFTGVGGAVDSEGSTRQAPLPHEAPATSPVRAFAVWATLPPASHIESLHAQFWPALLVMIATVTDSARRLATRRLAVDLGGRKRCHTISLTMACLASVPLALYSALTWDGGPGTHSCISLSVIAPAALVGVFTVVRAVVFGRRR